jgi:hypothetical protein
LPSNRNIKNGCTAKSPAAALCVGRTTATAPADDQRFYALRAGWNSNGLRRSNRWGLDVTTNGAYSNSLPGTLERTGIH